MKKVLIALSLAAATSSAQAVLLTDLLGGESITAGDKLFDQWEIIFSDSSDGRVYDTDNIDVTALNDGGLDPGPGLRYDISNGELGIEGDGFYSYLDFQIGFRVTVLDPELRIKDNSLELTSFELANPSFLTSVFIEEKVFQDDSLGDIFGTKNVFADNLQNEQLYDSVDFSPVNSIYVTTNILIEAGDLGESASLLGFDQRFSQVKVPEPGVLALFGTGLAAFGFFRRRKSS
ncbi:hypothetical protein BTA51_15985 [Hahella sp. CCB-MM4]|uniref:PEP-CTERM sorting domain-containing protein n=1 Tax=Hahella sp. (strain CCB-MM4) TaxID=1926491 RepID=UPI000B9AE63B|nr:PEP-CTERM sorting domain-containing protein [Hahella sp. CCB-MM4]OZG72242.1 hypothetical protein BTA51_15985 [Hahella sp. CCB-MM4]